MKLNKNELTFTAVFFLGLSASFILLFSWHLGKKINEKVNSEDDVKFDFLEWMVLQNLTSGFFLPWIGLAQPLKVDRFFMEIRRVIRNCRPQIKIASPANSEER